jgi:hypothetical protein
MYTRKSHLLAGLPWHALMSAIMSPDTSAELVQQEVSHV